MRRHAPSRIGLALDARLMVATLGAGVPPASAPSLWRRALAEPAAWAEPWPDLAEALAELRALVPRSRALDVALLPPIVQLREVELPWMRGADVRRVLQREAASWFLGRVDGLVIGVGAMTRTGRGRGRVVAAAAPEPVVRALFDEARAVGWRAARLTPAHGAWAVAAAGAGGRRRITADIAVAHGHHVAWLRVEGGEVRGARYVAAGDVAVARLVAPEAGDAGESAAPECEPAPARELRVLGDGPARDTLRAAARAAGRAPHEPLASIEPLGATDVAALHATRSRAPALLSAGERAVRRRTERRRSTMLAAAALLLVVASGVVALAGAYRELGRLTMERARLRPRIAAILAVRDSVARRRERLELLARLEGTAPRWSTVVARMATELPDDAYLLSLRGEGDSLVADGIADHAVDVFTALGHADALRAVHATAPIRQEWRSGELAGERFTLSALLASTATASAASATPLPHDARGDP